jgi:putative serine protease PepD
MDEQNPRYPENNQPGENEGGHDDRRDLDDTHPVFGPSTPAEDNYTRPIPPYAPAPTYYDQGASQPGGTQTLSRNRGLTAAVLVGALVLGGAAGVGGSAAFHAFQDDPTSTSSTGTDGKYQATSTALVKDGTVEKVASAVLPSVVKVNVTGQSGSGTGSGIILTKDGQILTNNHVVTGAGDGGTITVNFNDGTTKKATVVGTDPVTDIAVIKAEGVDDLTPASLGKSSALKVGQSVVAVGSPYGLNATVTSGIVSALNRPVSVSAEQEQTPQNPFGGEQGQQAPSQSLSTTYPAIQTDAAINPGNSGGALVDMSGRVVGINSSIRTASDSASSDSGGSIGLGFAIPIDEVLPIVNQITDDQKPTHARLGVSVSDVSGNSLTEGAQLQTIEDGGAGAKAGLKKGDVITKVDDQVVDGSESLVATIRGHRPGDSVELTYIRGGKTSTTTATLGSDESTQDS